MFLGRGVLATTAISYLNRNSPLGILFVDKFVRFPISERDEYQCRDINDKER